MKMQMPEPQVLPLDSIRPYWRNPRKISDEAVNALAQSLEEFGYLQPIVVDSERVIIVGHTRYAAMRKLGLTEAPVIITDLPADKVREFRLVDNKSGELTSWDYEALAEEVTGLDGDLVKALFADVIEGEAQPKVTVTDEFTSPSDSESVELICPTCFHSWDQPVTTADILSGRLSPLSAKPATEEAS